MTALALPLLPLIVAGILLALRRRPRALGVVAVGGLIATLALAAWAAAAEPVAAWRWSPTIELGLAVEGFSRVMVVLVPAIAAPIVAYAAATEEEGRARLLALMVAFVGVMLLLVTAADFLTLLLAWELVGAISWALIGHDWREPESGSSAAQAFVTTRTGDVGLYVAAGITFAAAGGFAYADLGAVGRPALDVIAAGVLIAAAAKSAQLPFSPWLFAAMAGPTPVSALLHSATLVAAGAYVLVRLAPALEPVGWFLPAVAGIGLATALAGGVVALVQQHAKRALAGSTSAQYGLMFVAVGAGSVAAGGAQLVAHAAFKSLLFLGAGVAIHAAGTQQLDGMRLGRALPRLAALSLVGALALAAVPPLGAAWTKEQIVAAAAHGSPWLAAAVFAAGMLTAAYAMRYHLLAFGTDGVSGTSEAHHRSPYRPGTAEVAAMGALAAITLLLSALWLPSAERLVEAAAGGALAPSAPWELLLSAATIAAAASTMWWLRARGLLTSLGLSPRVQAATGDWLGLPSVTRALVITPVDALARALSRLDDRVVDAGVRGVAAFAAFVSRGFAVHGEWTFDRIVHAAAEATMRFATGSRVADDQGIDGAIEDSARRVGVAGHASRRLQTGLAHHYYVIMAAGVAATVAVLAVAR